MFILLLHPLRAWSEVGHMIVAQVAYRRLNLTDPQAAQKFNSLLTSINHLTDGQSNSFAESACWPDDLKGSGFLIFNEWHFLNSLVVTDSVIPVLNGTQQVQNINTTLIRCNKTLSFNRDRNTAQRALMSRYFIHMVGDIHQPLHTVALFNKSMPSGDQGGNLFKVKYKNLTFNLHSLWDQGISYFQNKTFSLDRPMNEDNWTAFNRLVDDLVQQFPYEQLQQEAANLDVNSWTQYGLKIAKSLIYPPIESTNVIDEDTAMLWYKHCRRSVVLGGYRLANMISKIYAGSSTD